MRKILIVEDDAITARVYVTHLQRAGYEVRIATDGSKALEELSAFQPDGCLVDFMIPKISGIDLIKQIRSDPRMQKAPVILYTNAFIPNVIADATAAGATHVFDKAKVTPRELVDLFRHTLPATQQRA